MFETIRWIALAMLCVCIAMHWREIIRLKRKNRNLQVMYDSYESLRNEYAERIAELDEGDSE